MLFPFPFKWTPESKSGEDTRLWSEDGPGEPEGGSREILHNSILNNHHDALRRASRRACGDFTSHVMHKSRINIAVTTSRSSLNSSGPLLLVVCVVIKQKTAARENLFLFFCLPGEQQSTIQWPNSPRQNPSTAALLWMLTYPQDLSSTLAFQRVWAINIHPIVVIIFLCLCSLHN